MKEKVVFLFLPKSGGEAIAPAALVTDSPEIVHKVERPIQRPINSRKKLPAVLTVTYNNLELRNKLKLITKSKFLWVYISI